MYGGLRLLFQRDWRRRKSCSGLNLWPRTTDRSTSECLSLVDYNTLLWLKSVDVIFLGVTSGRAALCMADMTHTCILLLRSQRGVLCALCLEKRLLVFRQAHSEKHPGGWSVLPRRRHIQSGDYSMIPRSPDYPSCCLPEYFFWLYYMIWNPTIGNSFSWSFSLRGWVWGLKCSSSSSCYLTKLVL